MTVSELIYSLKANWDMNDEVIVKQGDKEYEIRGISWYADFYGKEGGSSPAIIIDDSYDQRRKKTKRD